MLSEHTPHSMRPYLSARRDGLPKHSTGFKTYRTYLRAIAMLIVAIVLFISSIAGATLLDLNTTVSNRTVHIISQKNKKKVDTSPLDVNAGKAINLLVIGQDNRDGDNAQVVGTTAKFNPNSHLADTTIVVQISPDRSFINLVSIPRDSLVNVPACTTSKGTIPARNNVMFNSIFAFGWNIGQDLASAATCTLTAVNALTGLNVDNFIVVDFHGLQSMIDAVGGVDLCIPVDTRDAYTNLNLKRGLQHLDGYHATEYARMRHGTGTDGSDIMRTARQQYLIKELVRQTLQKDVFLHTSQLYQLAKSALNSLNFSDGLGNIATLTGLAFSLRHFNTSRLYSQTIPIVHAPNNPNRVVWANSADSVWEKLRNNEPLTKDTSSTNTATTTNTQSNSQVNNQDTSQKTETSQNETTHSNNSSSQTPNTQANTPSDKTSSPSDKSQAASSNASKPSGIDPNTGLIERPDGTLIDPNTNGYVDRTTGIIRSSETGYSIGIAERYLRNVVCKVPTQ